MTDKMIWACMVMMAIAVVSILFIQSCDPVIVAEFGRI